MCVGTLQKYLNRWESSVTEGHLFFQIYRHQARIKDMHAMNSSSTSQPLQNGINLHHVVIDDRASYFFLINTHITSTCVYQQINLWIKLR